MDDSSFVASINCPGKFVEIIVPDHDHRKSKEYRERFIVNLLVAPDNVQTPFLFANCAIVRHKTNSQVSYRLVAKWRSISSRTSPRKSKSGIPGAVALI
jgi:hypothetical protein